MRLMTFEEKELFIKGYIYAKAEELSAELGYTIEEAQRKIYETITTNISKEIIIKHEQNLIK
ncbi:hypothetical protein QUF99_19305 [Bacillus sp. DX4.1]|uniref:hypothetical protein n=1 Tax=Bacillus sp. DX4.1 TaxID=3055867 RepID=UPI0025A12987|nr:hypothetical protein [Bacillus sp. DX4.1]MDM5189375.1 hypothetical protein [Bacillus sp. DX4.1]